MNQNSAQCVFCGREGRTNPARLETVLRCREQTERDDERGFGECRLQVSVRIIDNDATHKVLGVCDACLKARMHDTADEMLRYARCKTEESRIVHQLADTLRESIATDHGSTVGEASR